MNVVADLGPHEFGARLADAGIGVRIGPFDAHLRVRVPGLEDPLYRLYRDYPLRQDAQIYNFHIELERHRRFAGVGSRLVRFQGRRPGAARGHAGGSCAGGTRVGHQSRHCAALASLRHDALGCAGAGWSGNRHARVAGRRQDHAVRRSRSPRLAPVFRRVRPDFARAERADRDTATDGVKERVDRGHQKLRARCGTRAGHSGHAQGHRRARQGARRQRRACRSGGSGGLGGIPEMAAGCRTGPRGDSARRGLHVPRQQFV